MQSAAPTQPAADHSVPEENLRLQSFLRLGVFFVAAMILGGLIAWFAPAQLPVAAWKFTLITSGGFVGYWLDRFLFPSTRPHIFATKEVLDSPTVDPMGIILASTMIRRAIVVASVVVAVALAL